MILNKDTSEYLKEDAEDRLNPAFPLMDRDTGQDPDSTNRGGGRALQLSAAEGLQPAIHTLVIKMRSL